MKVLVTGGAGFVGSHVVDRLLDDGHAITIVDDLSTGRRELVNPRAALEVCDIRDPRLGAVMRAAGPEAVVHVAAQAAVSRSVEDPLFDASVNLLGTISVACAAQQVGVRRVVYISTGGAAYGDTDVVPTPEDHPTRATSPYGVSKVAAERYLECWSGLSGVPVMTLRLANVYGPRQNPRGEAGVGVPAVVVPLRDGRVQRPHFGHGELHRLGPAETPALERIRSRLGRRAS